MRSGLYEAIVVPCTLLGRIYTLRFPISCLTRVFCRQGKTKIGGAVNLHGIGKLGLKGTAESFGSNPLMSEWERVVVIGPIFPGHVICESVMDGSATSAFMGRRYFSTRKRIGRRHCLLRFFYFIQATYCFRSSFFWMRLQGKEIVTELDAVKFASGTDDWFSRYRPLFP